MFLKYFVLLVLWGTCVLGKNNLVILTSNTNEKNPLSITCLYDHQVTAGDIVKWNHTDVEGVTTKLESNSMSLNITSKSEAGEYSCIINGAVVSITTAAYVSQPFIQNARKSVTFNDGDVNRKLTCESTDSYPAVVFQWTRRENEDDVDMIISSDTDPNINFTETATTSTILFKNLTKDMKGYYSCQAQNVAGNSTVEVIIRVNDRLAALWPFLGIVAEVVILITVIFIYEKRSTKTMVQADEGKDEVEKPLKGQEGTELRNRMPNNNHK